MSAIKLGNHHIAILFRFYYIKFLIYIRVYFYVVTIIFYSIKTAAINFLFNIYMVKIYRYQKYQVQ